MILVQQKGLSAPRRNARFFIAILSLLLGAALALLGAPGARAELAQSDQDDVAQAGAAEAERFMRAVLTDANAALALKNRSAQYDAIAALVKTHGDLRRTGRFTLGKYARSLTPEQAIRFDRLFADYATIIYQNILDDFNGEALEVTGSVVRSPRDIIISTKIIGARRGDPQANTTVYWRLYRTPGGFKVVDAGANNIWLGIEQRSQFGSVIANNGGASGGGIEALLDQMEARVNDASR